MNDRETAEKIAAQLDGIVRSQRRASRDHLDGFGVTHGQLRVLRTLAHADGGLRLSVLAAKLGIVPRSATSVVDDLEAAGLVARTSDERDRRATLVALTEEGSRVLAAVRRSGRDALVGQIERLDAGDQDRLLALLTRLAELGEPC